jgi:hypothetical protein
VGSAATEGGTGQRRTRRQRATSLAFTLALAAAETTWLAAVGYALVRLVR